ncbi:MAG: zinc-ribbon domain-containing protein [Anaerolineaceae bacterium]|nr:zinc-ribbon domain-containing protein [Anaerolineaceae bacterium]
MNCTNCGKQLIDGASFCTNCGHKTEGQLSENPRTDSDLPRKLPENTGKNCVLVTCYYCGRKYNSDPADPVLTCITCGAELPKPKTETDIEAEIKKAVQEAEQKQLKAEQKLRETEQKLWEAQRRENERAIQEQQNRKRAEEKRLAERESLKKKRHAIWTGILILIIIFFCGGYFYIHTQNINIKKIREIKGFLSSDVTISSSTPTKTQKPAVKTPKPEITETPTKTITETPMTDAGGRVILPTDTRWPTITPRPTDTRWPTFTPRPTDTLRPTLTPKTSSQYLPESGTGNVDSNGVNIDMKNFLDSYEDYVDEYIAFMKSYDSGNVLLLVRYLSFLEKLDELGRNGEKWENNKSEMSYADYNYYMTVMNRINTKLLQAGQ